MQVAAADKLAALTLTLFMKAFIVLIYKIPHLCCCAAAAAASN